MRRFLTSVAMLAATASSFGLSAPADAADAQSTPAGFTQIAGCISGADNLLVSVVVDESLSLRQTDPKAMRVLGITAAIDSLEQLALVSPEVNVELSMSAFARTYSTLVDWTTLNAKSAGSFRKIAASELPRRDAGDATDYRKALLGAQKDLTRRAEQLGDQTSCKVVLWFTDGALDVDADTDTALTDICQQGGIADSVRHSGINVVALALFTPGANVTPAQRDQLKAVAEGRGDQATCGTVPISSDDALGVYLPADDPAALQLLFATAGALVGGGSGGELIRCPGPQCPGGVYSLAIDPGLSGTRVIVQGDTVSTLRDPSGQELELVDGATSNLSGAQVSVLKRGDLTTLNLTYSPYSSEPQTWSVIPGGQADIATYWFWGASLVAEEDEVQAGSKNKLRFRLVDASGGLLDANIYGRIDGQVAVGGDQLKTRVTKDGFLEASYDIGTDSVPSHLNVTASVSARTKPSGIRLGPISVIDRRDVTLPPAFPTITPTELDFGSLTGLGSRSADVTVTGSRLGKTSVCLASSSVVVPGHAASSSLAQSDPQCVDVPPNGTRTLRVTLKPTTSADGVASGDFTLDVTSAEGEHIDVTLPGSLSMERAVDQGRRWKVIAALVILALLIPLLLVVGSNLFLLGRFKVTSGTRTASVRVKVTGAGLRRADDEPGFVKPEDLQNLPIAGVKSGSRLSIDEVDMGLRAARIFSLRAPKGIATSHGGIRLLSSYRSADQPDAANQAPVGLGDVDAVFLRLDHCENQDNASGALILVVPQDVDASGAEERARAMANDIEWPRLLESLGASTAGASGSAVEAGGAEDRADLRWLDETPSQGTSAVADDSVRRPSFLEDVDEAPTTPPQPGRSRRLRRPNVSTQRPLQPPPPSHDDLPPLPDFLRDED